MKIELAKLEDQLLEVWISFALIVTFGFCSSKDLANATGNILENKELLQSLNKTKEKSATITNSLAESLRLGEELDKVKDKVISRELI